MAVGSCYDFPRGISRIDAQQDSAARGTKSARTETDAMNRAFDNLDEERDDAVRIQRAPVRGKQVIVSEDEGARIYVPASSHLRSRPSR